MLPLLALLACKDPSGATPDPTSLDTSLGSSCSVLLLPTVPFADAPESTALYATAADFTLPLLDADWTFSERFSGCDNYLFIPDEPAQNHDFPGMTWGNDADNHDFLAALPYNTEVFFVSTSRGEESREASLALQQTSLATVLDDLDDDAAAWWSPRLHYVAADPTAIEGWLGERLDDPGAGVAIDRRQRIRDLGSFADPTRLDESVGWFQPNIAMAANEAVYFNFEATRDAALAATDPTTLRAFDAQEISDADWAGVRGYATLSLPSAAEMATFDTLAFDLTLDCLGDEEFFACPAWDYSTYLHLCETDDPATCTLEIGRWITPYWREGRWVHDVSALLPLLQDGGDRMLSYYTQQPYLVTLDVHLSNAAKDARPAEVTPLFGGGYLSPTYNAEHPAVFVDVPADAVKVELATAITGHGAADPGTCAEFCEIENHFFVNGVENVVSYPEAGTTRMCQDQTSLGTIPNQYGTWWYGRNGWCPGKEVPLQMVDITEQVRKGVTNEFRYEADFRGEAYPGGDAHLEVQSWLLVSR